METTKPEESQIGSRRSPGSISHSKVPRCKTLKVPTSTKPLHLGGIGECSFGLEKLSTPHSSLTISTTEEPIPKGTQSPDHAHECSPITGFQLHGEGGGRGAPHSPACSQKVSTPGELERHLLHFDAFLGTTTRSVLIVYGSLQDKLPLDANVAIEELIVLPAQGRPTLSENKEKRERIVLLVSEEAAKRRGLHHFLNHLISKKLSATGALIIRLPHGHSDAHRSVTAETKHRGRLNLLCGMSFGLRPAPSSTWYVFAPRTSTLSFSLGSTIPTVMVKPQGEGFTVQASNGYKATTNCNRWTSGRIPRHDAAMYDLIAGAIASFDGPASILRLLYQGALHTPFFVLTPGMTKLDDPKKAWFVEPVRKLRNQLARFATVGFQRITTWGRPKEAPLWLRNHHTVHQQPSQSTKPTTARAKNLQSQRERQQRLKRARRSERRTAKRLGGQLTSRSGAGLMKGDIRTNAGDMVENKSTMNSKYRVRLTALTKLCRDARNEGAHPVMVIDFCNTKNSGQTPQIALRPSHSQSDSKEIHDTKSFVVSKHLAIQLEQQEISSYIVELERADEFEIPKRWELLTLSRFEQATTS